MLLPFAMPVQKFVMLVRRNAKNTTWIIANVAQKRAGGARKNAVQWPNNLPNYLNTSNLEDMYCPQGLFLWRSPGTLKYFEFSLSMTVQKC